MKNRLLRLALLSALTTAMTVPAGAQAPQANQSRDLRIAIVDVEGGAATLFVTPEGKSLLIDTGWAPGAGLPRPQAGATSAAPAATSAERIADAAQSMGIKKIDYLLMTHYHGDHVGGVPSLLAKIPVGTFIDHGPNRQLDPPGATAAQVAHSSAKLYSDWVAAYQGHEHISAHVGQKLHIGSLQLDFVASDGDLLKTPLSGAGEPNPLCDSVQHLDRNGGVENERSLGMVMTFGKTKILYLGDLTWNKEIELLCPVNRIGKVDVYFVTGHGMDLSSSPPTAALDPLVALMQNGPLKGGDEAVMKTVESYPHLQGLWQEHFSVRYPDLNKDPNMIANLDQATDMDYRIELAITPGGEITVTNDRNQFSKTYEARGARSRGRN